jgi:4a-hydroxytetrahydrobiopterin dehydratase
MTKPMAPGDIDDALVQLPRWKVVRDALEQTFEFTDFSEALGFIVRVGVEAERINHHPEISNVWNRVTLRLTTHDAGNKISERDFALAKAVQSLV